MPVKYKLKKEHIADIPKELLPFYVERDGFMFLDADGAVDNETLAEFRDNNREFMRLLGAKNPADAKTKLEKLKDIDPDEVATLRTNLKAFEDGKAPKLDELLASRTDVMKKDFEKREKEKDGSILTLTTRLSKLMIDDALLASATKKGVLPSAIEDVRLRGNLVFKLENDEVVAYSVDNKPRYGKDSKPLSIDEWMDELATQAKHLFGENKGSGAGGGGNNGGYNKPNPFSKKTENLTQQAILQRDNPQLAARLKQLAQSE